MFWFGPPARKVLGAKYISTPDVVPCCIQIAFKLRMTGRLANVALATARSIGLPAPPVPPVDTAMPTCARRRGYTACSSTFSVLVACCPRATCWAGRYTSTGDGLGPGKALLVRRPLGNGGILPSSCSSLAASSGVTWGSWVRARARRRGLAKAQGILGQYI